MPSQRISSEDGNRLAECYLGKFEGEDVVAIIDNAPVQSRVDAEFDQLNIKFLPTYFPFLNPIGNFISAIEYEVMISVEREISLEVKEY